MPLEAATYVGDLVTTNPPGTDAKSQGDDHLRLLKATLQATFPGMAGAFARVLSKSANYTVVANDNTTLIECTAALTLSLTAAATLGNKHLFAVFAHGANVTVDPNGAEEINDVASIIVPNGSFALIWCDGDEFFAFVQGGERMLNSVSVSAAASQAIVLPAGFSSYRVELLKFLPVTDSVALYMRTSTDGGSTFDSGASDYAWRWNAVDIAAAVSISANDSADSECELINTVGNTASLGGVNLSLILQAPSDTVTNKIYNGLGVVGISGAALPYKITNTFGARLATADVDALQFLFSSGNIASGTIRLFGTP